MQKETQLSKSVREYTRKSRRVAAPQNSRILTVHHGHGESFYDDPDVTLETEVPLDAQEYILSESNGARVLEVAQLLREQGSLRASARRLWGTLNRTAYSRVVAFYTSGWKRIRLADTYERISLQEAIARGYGHWSTRWRHVERISAYERLLRITRSSAYASFSKSQKDSIWESIRRWRINFEATSTTESDLERSVEWRTDPYKVFVPAVPGIRVHEQEGAFHVFRKTKHFKKVPNRDWTAIRKEWLRRIDLVQSKVAPMYRRLERISARLAEIYWRRSHTFNSCVQVRSRAVIPGATADRLTLNRRWQDHLTGYESSAMSGTEGVLANYVLGFMPGVHASSWSLGSYSGQRRLLCSCDNVEPIGWVEALNGSIELPEGELIECAEGPNMAFTFRVYPKLVASPDPEEDRWIFDRIDYEQLLNPARSLWSNECDEYLDGMDAKVVNNHMPLVAGYFSDNYPSPLEGIRLDDDVIVDGPEILDNRLITAATALAAGRLGGDEVAQFNYSRSLAELKDTEQSAQTLSSFFAFINGAKEHRQDFWEVTFSNGTRCRTFSTKWNDYAARRKALRRPKKIGPGSVWITKIQRYTIRGNTPLRLLAEAYLAYKFAVKPTVDDVNTLMKHSGEWLTASRRELSRLMRKWMDTPKNRVLRKYFRVGAFGNAPSSSPSRKQSLIFTKPAVPDTSFVDEWTLTAEEVKSLLRRDYTSFERVYSDKDPTKFVIVKRTKKGLMWFPNPSGLADWTPDEMRTLIERVRKHNLSVVPPALWGERLYYSPVVSGCVFALYGWDALKKMTDSSTWVDTLASLHLPKTLWELAPLSFVWQWFTNAAAIATAADDIFTADLTGLKPISGQWYSLAERIYASVDYKPDTFVMQRCIDAKWWVLLPVRDHVYGYDMGAIYCIPRFVKWEWFVASEDETPMTPLQFWGDGVELSRTSAVIYNRAPLGDEYAHTLPELRVRMNMDAGKLLSLLAIAKVIGRGRRVVPTYD